MRSLGPVPVLTLVTFAVAACGTSPTSPIDPAGTSPAFVIAPLTSGGVTQGLVQVCKVGTNATIDVSVNSGASAAHAVTDGSCVTAYTILSLTNVTASEVPPTGTALDSILAIRGISQSRSGPMVVDTVRVTGTNTATVGPVYSEDGVTFVFFNHLIPPPPPPQGGQGCTPGYWKQSQHFKSWVGYSPSTLFETVFGRDVPGNPTLLQALGANGGGIYALERHATAALLNSTTTLNYGMTTAGVIAAFQAAFDSGDYETQKNAFAARNESGCPLN